MHLSPKKEAVLVVLLQSILVSKVAILCDGCNFRLFGEVIKCADLYFRKLLVNKQEILEREIQKNVIWKVA